MIDIKKVKNIHFIGIGGIGISAIARMFLLEGKKVSGSDQGDSLVVKELKLAGAKIKIGHSGDNIPKDCDLVIYTIAVTTENPEFMAAKKRGIEMLTYPQALGLISAQKFTVAVAGTHGKTTTTGMVATITMAAKLDPTVIVGSLLKDNKNKRTNFIAGRSELFIVEACEYRRSFLNLSPKVVVITNIDADHLDYYKDIKDIQKAFIELVEKIPTDGFLVCDPNDKKVSPVIKKAKCRVIDYTKISKKDFKLLVPGDHNIKDGQAAIVVAKILGIDASVATKALNKFSGTWRRFEFKGKKSGALVYDDYAHHPTEISATVSGARQFMKDNPPAGGMSGRLIVAFQPHLYSRTKMLLKDFAKSLSVADIVLVAKIYASREKFDPTIKEEDLVKLINKNAKKDIARFAGDLISIEKDLEAEMSKGDLVITMGAGDISLVSDKLIG